MATWRIWNGRAIFIAGYLTFMLGVFVAHNNAHADTILAERVFATQAAINKIYNGDTQMNVSDNSSSTEWRRRWRRLFPK